MERKCSSCGARISEEMKICANCGKVVPPLRSARPNNSNASRQEGTIKAGSGNLSRGQASNGQRLRTSSEPQRRQAVPTQRYDVHSQIKEKPSAPRKRTDIKPLKKTEKDTRKKVMKALKIAVVILIIYIIISVIQIFRVRLSTYDFKVDMKMSRENYGQAIDSFFDSGHWEYNPFTFTVTYKGEKKHEGEYELKFSAVGSVKLKAVIVDGAEKDSDKLESSIMGLFI